MVNAQLQSVPSMSQLEERFACRLSWSERERAACLTHPKRGICRRMPDVQKEHQRACESIQHMDQIRRHLSNIRGKLQNIVCQTSNLHVHFRLPYLDYYTVYHVLIASVLIL